jgi:predicted nucleotidyltransferase
MTHIEDQILDEFRRAIERLYGKRLKSIILYGSWARDEATEDSDIDLAVVLEGDVVPGEEIDRMIDVVTEMNLSYGVLISVYPVSEKHYQTLDSPLLLNIRKEGIPA